MNESFRAVPGITIRNQIQTTRAYRTLFGLHLANRLLHLPPLYNSPLLASSRKKGQRKKSPLKKKKKKEKEKGKYVETVKE